MTMTSIPIADMLTSVRNASSAMHDEVLIPQSKIKENIAQILVEEGYVDDLEVVRDEGTHPMIRIQLRYSQERSGDRRDPQDLQAGTAGLPQRHRPARALGGLGIAIISTSQGLMTDKQAPCQGRRRDPRLRLVMEEGRPCHE